MAYKTILVHCDDSDAGIGRLKVAMQMARTHDAHLVGVGVMEPPVPPAYFESPDIVELLRLHADRRAARGKALEESFAAATRGSGLRLEWRLDEGQPATVLSTAMRYADLGILGQYQPDAAGSPAWRSLPETVAMTAGRPVLVVPYIGVRQTVGRHVLLAWNASHQSTRAAGDALPLLRRADKVTVLVVDGSVHGISRPPHGEEPGADVAAWLARHDVKVDVVRDISGDIDVASIILSRASDMDVDLVVMGVYGHSRLRELVLGGVSRAMLAQMTAPVLISH